MREIMIPQESPARKRKGLKPGPARRDTFLQERDSQLPVHLKESRAETLLSSGTDRTAPGSGMLSLAVLLSFI